MNTKSLKKQEPIAQTETRRSRLVGWLISYAVDEKGAYHEIRAGRSLITSLDGSDQILEQKVISIDGAGIDLPHAALKASSKHRLMLNDVFSQQGTYIRKAGSNSESKVEGPIEVGHGDWLRFGAESRFQVCLIDAPTGQASQAR
jgi:hypothetical protein